MSMSSPKVWLGALLLAASMVASAQGTGSRSHSAPPQGKAEQPESSVKDVYRNEHAYFGDKLTIVPQIRYSHSNRNKIDLRGFLALDAIFLGRISLDEVSYDTVETSLTFRYDLTDRLQLQATVPYLFRHAQFQSAGEGGTDTPVEASVSGAGLGDVSARAYYHVHRENESWPDLVVYAGFRAPTGKDPFGIHTRTVNAGKTTQLRYPTDLPMGNGVWSALTGMSILRTYDPAILFASLGYEYSFAKNFDDLSSAAGDQPGQVDLGDIYRLGLGTAFALNRRLSLSFSYSQEVSTKASQKPKGGSSHDIIGSDANVGSLNLGMTLAISNKRSLVANIAAGLTQDAPDVMVGVSMPISL